MNKYKQGKEQAKAKALEWSINEAQRPKSWGEYAEQVAQLERLAKRYGLIKEFKENGII